MKLFWLESFELRERRGKAAFSRENVQLGLLATPYLPFPHIMSGNDLGHRLMSIVFGDSVTASADKRTEKERSQYDTDLSLSTIT